MVLVLAAVILYWTNPPGNPMIDNIALILIGFLIYGPVMLIGVHALDLVPKKAARNGRRVNRVVWIFGRSAVRQHCHGICCGCIRMGWWIRDFDSRMHSYYPFYRINLET